MFLEEN